MSRALKSRLKSRVIVTLKSGEAFDGILWSADRDVWILRDATAVQAGPRNQNIAVDGETVLLTSEISYAQRP